MGSKQSCGCSRDDLKTSYTCEEPSCQSPFSSTQAPNAASAAKQEEEECLNRAISSLAANHCNHESIMEMLGVSEEAVADALRPIPVQLQLLMQGVELNTDLSIHSEDLHEEILQVIRKELPDEKELKIRAVTFADEELYTGSDLVNHGVSKGAVLQVLMEEIVEPSPPSIGDVDGFPELDSSVFAMDELHRSMDAFAKELRVAEI